MSVLRHDIYFYGSALMPDSDSDTQIGGAIDLSEKVVFKDIGSADEVEAVSSAAGDTTQTITVTGRTASGAKETDVISLNGTTPAQAGTPITFERLMKAVKSATCTGTVAVMNTTNSRANTAVSSGTDGDGNFYVELDSGASAADDFYKNMVLRFTSGDNQNAIFEIIKYVGSSKYAYVRAAVTDGAADGYEVAEGIVFEKTPSEIDEVRRIHYDEVAAAAGGSDKLSYDKFFIKNASSTNALTNAEVSEVAGGVAAKENFGLDAAVDASTDNGAGNNRNVAPGGITFNSTAKAVPGGNLDTGEAIGVWVELDLDAGDAAQDSYYEIQIQGNST